MKTAAPAAKKSASSTSQVEVSRSALGSILVSSDGHTLYGFTNDTNGTSSCTAMCAQNWPPLIVSANWTAGAGAEGAHLHTITRGNGQLQLAAGKWPLYTFAGDRAAGDVNGQGSLGKWFVVQPDGSLHKASSASSSPTTLPSSGSGYGY